MAKGTEEKQLVAEKILSAFDGAFMYNGGKEIRIPINDLQIKVALTCAKDNVAPGDETAVPTKKTKTVAPKEGDFSFADAAPQEPEKPLDEELDNIANLLGALGL